VTMLPSHAHDSAADATWPRCDIIVESCWQQCCRVMLETVRCRWQVMLAIMLLSHTRDGAAEATWPRHDVDVK
jgi:hypothetical protein